MAEETPGRTARVTHPLTAPVDAALDAEARRAAWEGLVSEARHVAQVPFLPRFRPRIQAQLNPALRRHPEWPGEWYVAVPDTPVTIFRQAAARLGVRPELHVFPTADAAAADAQAVWRAHWGQRLKSFPAEAVIQPDVVEEFTVRWHHPEDEAAWADYRAAHPEYQSHVVVRYRDIPAAERALWATAPARDLEDLTWGEATGPDPLWDLHRTPRSTPAAAGAPAPWTHPAGRAFLEATDVLLASTAGLAPTDAGLLRGDITRFRDALQQPEGAPPDPKDPTPSLTSPLPFRKNLHRISQLIRNVAAPTGDLPPGLDFARRQWIESFEWLTADDVGLFATGTLPADLFTDGDVYTSNRFLEEHSVGRAHRMPNGAFVLWQGTDTPLGGLTQLRTRADGRPQVEPALYPTWAAVTTAAEARGLARVIPENHPDVPAAWTSVLTTVMSEDRATQLRQKAGTQLRLHPLPSGQLVAWLGRAPIGTDGPPEVVKVWPRLFDDVAAVRRTVESAGRVMPPVIAHDAVPERWADALRQTSPASAEATIAAALTPAAPVPAAPAARPAAPVRWHLSPWGRGRAVWWSENPATEAVQLGGPEGTVVLPANGFADAVSAARTREPSVTPADLPQQLAKELVDPPRPKKAAGGVTPPRDPVPCEGPVRPRDMLWHVSQIDQVAVGWSRPWTPEALARQRPFAIPAPVPLCPEGRAELIQAPTVERLVSRLAAAGAVAVDAGRLLPQAVARTWSNSTPGAAQLLQRRHTPAPFEKVAALPQAAQRALIDTLPDRVRSAAHAAVHGLAPRDVADLWGLPLDRAVLSFRAAERALGRALQATPLTPVRSL